MGRVSEVVAQSTIDRVSDELRYDNDYEPRHHHAGPAYEYLRINGANADPRDRTRAKVPSIKFAGTDAQLQEEFDKRNDEVMVRELSRPGKLDVNIYKLEVKQRQQIDKLRRELERQLRIAQTIREYVK